MGVVIADGLLQKGRAHIQLTSDHDSLWIWTQRNIRMVVVYQSGPGGLFPLFDHDVTLLVVPNKVTVS